MQRRESAKGGEIAGVWGVWGAKPGKVKLTSEAKSGNQNLSQCILPFFPSKIQGT